MAKQKSGDSRDPRVSAVTDAAKASDSITPIDKQCHDIRNSLAAIQFELRRLQRALNSSEHAEICDSILEDFAATSTQIERLIRNRERRDGAAPPDGGPSDK